MKKKMCILTVATLALCLATFAAAKNDNSGGSNKNSNSNKSSQSEKKSTKKVNLKNFEKPDKATGKTNAQVHKEKTQAVIQNLEQVANQEETSGNPEVSDDVTKVAVKQQQMQQETVQAMEQVETRNKWKTFLIGSDYKNLGQLRSSLVQNRNQIRELTRTMSQVQNEADATLLQQQLETLMQERERIKSVIMTNESGFSVLGWVVKFLTGYEQAPIDDQEEAQLMDAVEEAINNAPTGDDTTLPAGTAPVAPKTVQ